MGAKEKRQKELELITLKRKSEVIDAAKEIFKEKGLERATIKEIANRAEVGVASVYRYYTSKSELIQVVAGNYLEEYVTNERIGKAQSGIYQVENILSQLFDDSESYQDMFCFMEQYENYSGFIEKKEPLELAKNKLVNQLKEAISIGISDCTVEPSVVTKEVEERIANIVLVLLTRYWSHNIEGIHDKEELMLFQNMTINYLRKK